MRRLALPPSVRVVHSPLARRRGRAAAGMGATGREYQAPGGPLVLRDRCLGLAAAPARGRPRSTPSSGPDKEREVLARSPRSRPARWWSPTPRGRWSATWPSSTPSPGPASPACPGCWRWGDRGSRCRLAPGWGGQRPPPLRRRARPVRGPDPDRLRPGLALGPGAERPAGRRSPAVPGRVFEAAGFETLRTDEPEIAYRQANLFVAWIGGRVPPARRAAFTSRLVRGHVRDADRLLETILPNLFHTRSVMRTGSRYEARPNHHPPVGGRGRYGHPAAGCPCAGRARRGRQLPGRAPGPSGYAGWRPSPAP